ncbi:MAG: nicotinate (nicotinamide) nucleotide adenylyltransferase [Planctomycetota bacterium]
MPAQPAPAPLEPYTGPDFHGRIGFLGGSFNPVHLGHLSIAQQVRAQVGLLKVVLVPNNRSPFKQDADGLAAPVHRLAMCRLAAKNLRGLEVSDCEIKLPPPNYTIDTFRAWHADGVRPVMILGADALAGLPDWKDAAELPTVGDFLWVSRPGVTPTDELRRRFVQSFGPEVAERILSARVPIEPVEISSTEIRSRLQSGREVKRFVRGDVLDYIRRYKLYGAARS